MNNFYSSCNGFGKIRIGQISPIRRKLWVRWRESFFSMLGGGLKQINNLDKGVFELDLMLEEANKTSEIEGELLNRDSLQSSLRKQFGLQSNYQINPPDEKYFSDLNRDDLAPATKRSEFKA